MREQPVAVIGASGAVGERLVPALLEAGVATRAVVRDCERARRRLGPAVPCVAADVLQPETLPAALDGARAVYYLVEMMADTTEFLEPEMRAIHHTLAACHAAGVRRLLMLGGLRVTGKPEQRRPGLARARELVESAVVASDLDYTVLRAGPAIGRGSLSFELMFDIAQRLPALPAPPWTRARVQPIALGDAVRYLVAALDDPRAARCGLDIGGPDVLAASEMLALIAEEVGQAKASVPVPGVPKVASLGAPLVTDVPTTAARSILDGLEAGLDLVCQDDTARELYPFEPLTFREAIRVALAAPAEERPWE